MIRLKSLCYAVSLIFFVNTHLQAKPLIKNSNKFNIPIAEKVKHDLIAHGDVRSDEYYWLKERENPKVIRHLKKENQYLDQVLKPTEKLQKTLFQEMRSRIKEDDSSYPLKRGPWLYYTRFEKGRQYPIFARKKTIETEIEEVIFDVNKLAKKFEYYSADFKISPDHQLAALCYDTVGRRFYNLKVKNLKTGKFLNSQLKNLSSNIVWANDNTHLFYAKQNPDTLRHYQIWRFNVQNGENVLVYEEKDETFETFVGTSLARKNIFIGSYSTLSSEIRTIPADQPALSPKLLFARERGHEFSVNEDDNYFYILSNKNALNFQILRFAKSKIDQNKSNPSGEKIEDAEIWVKHRNDSFIDNFEVFKDHIVVNSRSGGLMQLEVINKKNQEVEKISFKDSAYSVEIGSHAEYDAASVRYVYQSLRSPVSIWDWSFSERKSILRKTKEVPNYDSELYISERIFAQARDGQKIPISLLRKKTTPLDGSSPILIYGYGSYGSSLDPWFSSSIFSLIDRGFIYAIAHVRGGGEMGRSWTDDGRTLKKKNTFWDFIDSTEHLIKMKYADPKQVFAMGGSAGGLLMGAVINLRPDLYKGVVAQVPFVDVLTTMLDESIPLTTSEYDEWGNPNQKLYYDYIKSYSPYDNIKPANFPHILITTGLHDSQVQYWEPAKWAARLRQNNSSRNLILLKTDMKSGHGGKSGRYDQLKETALEFAFILGL